jgi:thioredoxin-like negative regulator of GroEL
MLHSIECQKATKGDIGSFLSAAWACDQPVIVKFETQWCGPCRALGQFLETQVLRYPGLVIVRVDCERSEENRAYAAACGVSGYPMTQYYANGVLVETVR